MFAAVNLFGYVSGILPVFIIVIINKSIISSGINFFFWQNISRILLEIAENRNRWEKNWKNMPSMNP